MAQTRSVVLVAMLACASATADEVRMAVTSAKPLLMEAVRRGEAHGTFVGAWADKAKVAFDTDAPILVDVRAIGSVPQPGCKRLEVVTSQAGVRQKNRKTGEVTRKDARVVYQISYCEDGTFPRKVGVKDAH